MTRTAITTEGRLEFYACQDAALIRCGSDYNLANERDADVLDTYYDYLTAKDTLPMPAGCEDTFNLAQDAYLDRLYDDHCVKAERAYLQADQDAAEAEHDAECDECDLAGVWEEPATEAYMATMPGTLLAE